MRIFSSTRGKVAALSVAILASIALVPVFHTAATWGPVRTTFTWANPATYVTFNSITDNPSVGDERTFYTAYEVGTSNRVDPINVRDNEEVALQVYFHNNAASNLNLTAINTRVKMLLPTTEGTSLNSTASISADNATPGTVTDTVDFTGSQPFTLEYEAGTAKLWTNYTNGTPLSDTIVTSSGALIGTNGPDGKVPGCSQFSGYVTIRVRIHVKPIPPPVVSFTCTGLDVAEVDRTHFNLTAHAAVQNASVTSYGFTAKDSNGNVVDTKTVTTTALSAPYAFTNSNPGTYTISAVVNTDKGSTNPADCTKTVTVRQLPPPNVKFACTGLEVDQASDTAFKFTAHGSVENAVISSYNFVAKDANGNTVDSKTVSTNANTANYTFNQSNPGNYTVSAVVNTDHGSTNPADCVKTVTVKQKNIQAVCSALDVTTGANRAITATVSVTPAGSVPKAISYDFGDGSTPLLTDKVTADHTYAKDGTYIVAATVTFDTSKDQLNTSRCVHQVTITTPVTPVVEGTHTPLPNTGPGDVFGLFTGVSAFGAAGHYLVSRRRR